MQSIMQESLMAIKGPDGNSIFGRLCTEGHKRLIVHVPGLIHGMDHFLGINGRDFFVPRGFDHYRVSLYDFRPQSRKLPESTLTTHVRDLQEVLNHFAPKYEEIFITAHSLGALAVAILNPKNVKAISLWDPSFDVTHFWSTGPFLKRDAERGRYEVDYGVVFLLSDEMVDEIKLYPDAKCLDLAKKVKTPVQMVVPSESIFLASPSTAPENYASAFSGAFDLQRIEAANHLFAYPGNGPKLYGATLNWFKKHSLG